MPQKHVDHYKIHIAERSHKAKDMRVLGYTYPQIAEELGVSLQTVRNDIKRYTEELPREHVEEQRQLQLEQLSLVIRKLSPRVAKGDYKATDLYLKTLDRISKLTGTDQPAEDRSGEASAREALNAMIEAINRSVD